MKQLLHFLIELAHTAPYQTKLAQLMQNESQTVQDIFHIQDAAKLQAILTQKPLYSARTVAMTEH